MKRKNKPVLESRSQVEAALAGRRAGQSGIDQNGSRRPWAKGRALGVLTVFCLACKAYSFPLSVGTDPVSIAVNPITNKVYVASMDGNKVTVIDAETGGATSLDLSTRCSFAAVDVVANKIYAACPHSNIRVIDGLTNQVTIIPDTGASDFVVCDPSKGKMYFDSSQGFGQFRLDGGVVSRVAIPASTFSEGTPMVLDSVLNRLGIVDITDRYDFQSRSAAHVSLAMPSSFGLYPFSYNYELGTLAVNPVSHRLYVSKQHFECDEEFINCSSDGAGLLVINEADNTTEEISFPGGSLARSVALNPVTNKIYVGDGDNENPFLVRIVSGGDNSYVTKVASPTFGVGRMIVNPVSDVVYSFGGSFLLKFRGSDFALLQQTSGDLITSCAFNVLSNKVYITTVGGSLHEHQFEPADLQVPLVTMIDPLPGNTSLRPDPSFHLHAVSNFQPIAPAIQQIFYQVDSKLGPWQKADLPGDGGTAHLANLSPGGHTLYAFATDGQESGATNVNGGQSPIVGRMAEYAFSVTAPRDVGDFDASGCTNVVDFLIMLDFWGEPYQGGIVGLTDFLHLLDHWQAGSSCA